MTRRTRTWLTTWMAIGVLVAALPALATVSTPVTSGLIAGFDASDVTLNGATVASWNDQSGHGNHALQASATNQPTIAAGVTPSGLDALSFDGATSYLDIASNPTDFDFGTLTWYVVFQTDSFSNGRMINGAYSDINPDPGITTASYGVWAQYPGSGSTANQLRTQVRSETNGFIAANSGTDTINSTDFFIGGGVWNNGTGDLTGIVVDGANNRITVSNTGGTAVPTGHLWTRIGAGSSLTSPTLTLFYDGQIAEILVYNRVLDSTEQSQVESYLYNKHLVAGFHAGDANGDGMVNLADLQILGDNWQSTTATWAQADFTGDGNVNLADLQILGDNWGYGVNPDLSFDEALAQVSIPEPAALSLLGVGAMALLRRRK